MAVFKEITGNDFSTVRHDLQQIVEVVNSEIATDTQRRLYQTWATASVENLDNILVKFLDGFTQSQIENKVISGMFETVYDQDFDKQTANEVFGMTFGIHENSPIRQRASLVRRNVSDNDDTFPINALGQYFTLDENGDLEVELSDEADSIDDFASFGKDANGNYIFPKYTLQMNTKLDIYRQHAKELLGSPDEAFYVPRTDEDDDEDTRIDAALFIRFNRLFKRDGVLPKSLAFKFLYSVDEYDDDDVPTVSELTSDSAVSIDDDELDTFRGLYNEAYFGNKLTPGSGSSAGLAGPSDDEDLASTSFPLPSLYGDSGRGKLFALTRLDNVVEGGKDKTTKRLITYSDSGAALGRSTTRAGAYSVISRIGDAIDPIYPLGVTDDDDDDLTETTFKDVLRNDSRVYHKKGRHVGLMFLDAGVLVLDLQKVIDFTQEVSGTIKSLISDQLEPTIGNSDGSILFAGQMVDFLIRASLDDILDHFSKRFGYGKVVSTTETVLTEENVESESGTVDSLSLSTIQEVTLAPEDTAAIVFRNRAIVNTNTINIEVEPDEFNYSNNPTYVDSENRIVVVEPGSRFEKPFAFFTTVLLYDANDRLLAVGKVSRPVESGPQSKVALQIKLDY